MPNPSDIRAPLTQVRDGVPVRIDRPDARVAVVFLHGFTGSPKVWQELAHRLAGNFDVSVSVPLLPGHGTSPKDMSRSTWRQWRDCAVDEARRLHSVHDQVIVCGLSMGGALALEVGLALPQIHRLILVNPALFVDSPVASLTPLLKHFVPYVQAIGGDIAQPDQDEAAYERTPVAAVAQLHRGLKSLRPRLWALVPPVTLFISSSDHVVRPRSVRYLRHHLETANELVIMRNSYHVATLDYDAAKIYAYIARSCELAGASSMSSSTHTTHKQAVQ